MKHSLSSTFIASPQIQGHLDEIRAIYQTAADQGDDHAARMLHDECGTVDDELMVCIILNLWKQNLKDRFNEPTPPR